MTLKLTDLIVSPSRGSVEEAMAYAKRQGAKRQPFLLDYFTELWRLCKSVSFDAAVLVAQSANETDSWRSAIWQQYGNPAGLAVTNSQNLSVVYQSGTDAARAHVVHMWAYRYGRVPKGSELASYTDLDGHYDAVFTTKDTRGNPLAASVRTIADFNVNGRWALLDRSNTPTGPLDDYGNRIVQNGRAVWPNLPDQSPPVQTPSTPEEPAEQEQPVAAVFGRVPEPDVRDRQIPNSQNMAWDDLGQRTADAVHWHRMEGNLNGTDGYFRGFANAQQTKVGALTDYGVGTVDTDGSSYDGVAYQWNDPLGRRSGWASGPYSYFGDAYGDGVKLKERFNTKSACNLHSVSIEISGGLNSTLSQRAKRKIAEITAYWADQRKIPYDQFPMVPGENRSFVIWHEETCGPKYKTCPGPVVKAATDEMIAMVVSILKQYQVVDTDQPSEPAEPVPPAYAEAHPVEKGSRIVNDYVFLAPGGKTVQVETAPLEWANDVPSPTGPVLKKGTKITQEQISHYVVGTDGKQWVVLTGVPGVKDGSRFPATALIADAA